MKLEALNRANIINHTVRDIDRALDHWRKVELTKDKFRSGDCITFPREGLTQAGVNVLIDSSVKNLMEERIKLVKELDAL